MIKTTGQSSTPQVRLKEYVPPNKWMAAGFHPSVVSREKIFTPINSAIRAEVRKIPARMINNLVGLFLMIVWIIQVKYIV
jgi:hypothetical protein